MLSYLIPWAKNYNFPWRFNLISPDNYIPGINFNREPTRIWLLEQPDHHPTVTRKTARNKVRELLLAPSLPLTAAHRVV